MAKKDSGNVFAAGAKAAEKDMKKIVRKQVPQKTDEEDVAFTVRISPALHKKARYYSIESRESMNSLIVRLLDEFFAEE